MPLYMDRHDGIMKENTRPQGKVSAHLRDLAVQGKYGVRYITSWADEAAGQVFCLVDAPSPDAAEAVHREAHGMIANEIIEVNQRVVEEFMGRIAETPLAIDPASTETVPAVRTILFTDMESSVETTRQLGDWQAMDLLRTHNAVIRDALKAHHGREVKHTGDGIMASFVSASGAVECAIAIQRAFAAHNDQSPNHPLHIKIGISAGEPVMDNEDLFGAAVQLAKRVCDCAEPSAILVANVVRELCIGKSLLFADRGDAALRGFEDPVRLFEARWRE